jgi:hypothetical protein
MKKENEELDVAKYKDELASLRRVAVQLNELRKWLLNTSLASLAFAFAVMFQVKGGGNLPNPSLAAFTIVFLIMATAGSMLIRGKNELESFMADSKGFFPFLPVLRDLLMDSPELSEEDKRRFAGYLDRAASMSGKDKQGGNNGSPYTDIILIVGVFILLITGLGCLCFYIWRFLFGV